jgi:ubiquinone/menaquinone biosynthesis C-methylase UbiE
LAGGTGWWSQHLAQTATSLTVLDSSDETLRINRERVGRPDVTYIVADIFGWHPDHRYDTVFFSFWLSHVPRRLFETFWALVGSCLRPGGKAVLIDNRRDPTRAAQDPYIIDEADDVQIAGSTTAPSIEWSRCSMSQTNSPSVYSCWVGSQTLRGHRGSSTDLRSMWLAKRLEPQYKR